MIIKLLVICARRGSLWVFLRDLCAYHIFFCLFFSPHTKHNRHAMAGRTQYDDAVVSVPLLHVMRFTNNIDVQQDCLSCHGIISTWVTTDPGRLIRRQIRYNGKHHYYRERVGEMVESCYSSTLPYFHSFG